MLLIVPVITMMILCCKLAAYRNQRDIEFPAVERRSEKVSLSLFCAPNYFLSATSDKNIHSHLNIFSYPQREFLTSSEINFPSTDRKKNFIFVHTLRPYTHRRYILIIVGGDEEMGKQKKCNSKNQILLKHFPFGSVQWKARFSSFEFYWKWLYCDGFNFEQMWRGETERLGANGWKF